MQAKLLTTLTRMDHIYDYISFIICIITLLLNVVLNVGILAAPCVDRILRQKRFAILISLAAADIIKIVPLISELLISQHRITHCLSFASLGLYLICVSTLHLLFESINRLIAIARPLRYNDLLSKKLFVSLLIMVWFLPVLGIILPHFVLTNSAHWIPSFRVIMFQCESFTNNETSPYTNANGRLMETGYAEPVDASFTIYSAFITIIYFLIPLIVMLLSYSVIFNISLKHIRQIKSMERNMRHLYHRISRSKLISVQDSKMRMSAGVNTSTIESSIPPPSTSTKISYQRPKDASSTGFNEKLEPNPIKDLESGLHMEKSKHAYDGINSKTLNDKSEIYDGDELKDGKFSDSSETNKENMQTIIVKNESVNGDKKTRLKRMPSNVVYPEDDATFGRDAARKKMKSNLKRGEIWHIDQGATKIRDEENHPHEGKGSPSKNYDNRSKQSIMQKDTSDDDFLDDFKDKNMAAYLRPTSESLLMKTDSQETAKQRTLQTLWQKIMKKNENIEEIPSEDAFMKIVEDLERKLKPTPKKFEDSARRIMRFSLLLKSRRRNSSLEEEEEENERPTQAEVDHLESLITFAEGRPVEQMARELNEKMDNINKDSVDIFSLLTGFTVMEAWAESLKAKAGYQANSFVRFYRIIRGEMRNRKKEGKLVKTLGILFTAWIVFYVPILAFSWKRLSEWPNIKSHYYGMGKMLISWALLSSALNPIIYCLRIQEFKKTFKKIYRIVKLSISGRA